MIPPDFHPSYARTRAGLMHYVRYGNGAPLVLLHQLPGAWDEFRELMPLLEGHTALAMDMIGYGCSELIEDHSIERYAEALVALLDHLDLPPVDVLGHKLGGIVAVEASAQRPELFNRLILSGAPRVDAVYRNERSSLHPMSLVDAQDDGRHLDELWVKRSGFYPPARPDLLNRFVRNALWLEHQAEDGHHAISRYRMEGRTTHPGPVLCLAGTADPVYSHVRRLAESFPNSRVVDVPGGTVPLMEHKPAEVAAIVNEFLNA